MRGLTVGRVVHWVTMDEAVHLAAIITHVYDRENGFVQLAVFPYLQSEYMELKPTLFPPIAVNAAFSSDHTPGSWHWLERV